VNSNYSKSHKYPTHLLQEKSIINVALPNFNISKRFILETSCTLPPTIKKQFTKFTQNKLINPILRIQITSSHKNNQHIHKLTEQYKNQYKILNIEIIK
jgi:hypothetical protein